MYGNPTKRRVRLTGVSQSAGLSVSGCVRNFRLHGTVLSIIIDSTVMLDVTVLRRIIVEEKVKSRMRYAR